MSLEPYYDSDGITLYHGDCLEILPEIATDSVGLVVADPPYGINTKSDGYGKLNPWADLLNSALFYKTWIAEARRVLNHNGALWSFLNWRSMVSFQKTSCDLSWPITSLLVWDKEWIGPGGMAGLRPSYELVALWAQPEFAIENRGLPDVIRSKWSGNKPTGHPAEKPPHLIKWLVEISGGDGMVLDPFSGSGTTLRASKDAGRPAIGIEVDERWCEYTARRLAQKVLF